MKDSKVKKIALLGMCCAAAMILSYVESFIPFGVPGLKVGLPNIVVVFLLYNYGWKEAGAVSVLRVVLTSVLFGSVMSMAYSLAGAVLSLAAMAILKRVKFFSPIGVSVVGAVTHNAAQIGVAVLVMSTAQIAYYLPVLAAAGVISGIVIGVAGGLMVKRFSRNKT